MQLGACLFSLGLLTVSVVGRQPTVAQWPHSRGPNGSGVSETDKPPTTFGPSSNRLWQAVVPPGHSSPAIWSDLHLRDGRREQHAGRYRTSAAGRHDTVATARAV